MQVCKNKNSGKYFIYAQDIGNDELLLITPDAEVKSLQTGLFCELEEKDENSRLLARNYGLKGIEKTPGKR